MLSGRAVAQAMICERTKDDERVTARTSTAAQLSDSPTVVQSARLHLPCQPVAVSNI
jgi:hypothetical protein